MEIQIYDHSITISQCVADKVEHLYKRLNELRNVRDYLSSDNGDLIALALCELTTEERIEQSSHFHKRHNAQNHAVARIDAINAKLRALLKDTVRQMVKVAVSYAEQAGRTTKADKGTFAVALFRREMPFEQAMEVAFTQAIEYVKRNYK